MGLGGPDLNGSGSQVPRSALDDASVHHPFATAASGFPVSPFCTSTQGSPSFFPHPTRTIPVRRTLPSSSSIRPLSPAQCPPLAARPHLSHSHTHTRVYPLGTALNGATITSARHSTSASLHSCGRFPNSAVGPNAVPVPRWSRSKRGVNRERRWRGAGDRWVSLMAGI
jgi:hypothetical protein